MQKKKVIFITCYIKIAKKQFAIGKKLQAKGIEVIFANYSKECANFFKKNNAKCIYIPDHLNKIKLKKPIKEYLKYIEKQYNTPSLNLLIAGDIDLQSMKREKALKILIKNFLFWEKFFKENKTDIMIGGIERILNEAPRYVCKKNKIKYLGWVSAQVKDHFMLSEDHMGHWDRLNKYWNKNKNRKLTTKEKKKVKEFIDSITKTVKQKHLVQSIPATKPARVNLSNIKLFLQRLWINTFVEKGRNPYSNIIKIGFKQFMRSIRKHFAKHLYSKPNYKEDFIFFPMHVFWDAQIIVRAPQFSNPVWLIEYITKCIPSYYKLYVKEHPNDIGGNKLKTLNEIRKIPNVVLIDPNEPSSNLIKKSKAIVCINSTVGWEGILYDKKVINLGNVFYDISGLVWKIRNLYELIDIFKIVEQKTLITQEKKYRFINAVLNSVLEGSLDFFNDERITLDDKHITSIANEIYNHFL